MNIQATEIELTLKSNEANDIAYSILHDLENSIDTHWKNYPDAFLERESTRIRIMEELFASTGMFHYAIQVREELMKRIQKLQPTL